MKIGDVIYGWREGIESEEDGQIREFWLTRERIVDIDMGEPETETIEYLRRFDNAHDAGWTAREMNQRAERARTRHYKKGDIVWTLFDTGALGSSALYGVVVQCGPSTYTVRWESGLQNRRRHGYHNIDMVRESDREYAIERLMKLGELKERPLY